MVLSDSLLFSTIQQPSVRVMGDLEIEGSMSPEATISSRTIDISSMPSDSLMRVAEMSRARRARLLADEETWAQEVNFQDKADEYVQHEAKILSAEEGTARNVLARNEEKGFDRICRMFAEQNINFRGSDSRFHQQREFEAKKAAEIKRLQQELQREAFRAFWEKEKASNSHSTKHRSSLGNTRGSQPGDPHDVTLATSVLRMAYEHSVPPFVTDPEEVWRRGVTVAPDLQRSFGASHSTRHHDGNAIGSELNLPTFHEYSRTMQEKFMKWKLQQQQQEQQHYQQAAADSQKLQRDIYRHDHSQDLSRSHLREFF